MVPLCRNSIQKVCYPWAKIEKLLAAYEARKTKVRFSRITQNVSYIVWSENDPNVAQGRTPQMAGLLARYIQGTAAKMSPQSKRVSKALSRRHTFLSHWT